MKTTLLIMAAGLGSRYGGNKQMDRIGPGGEILMEYSVHDALCAGFDKVVFVIRRSMDGVFQQTIGSRIARKAETCYAYQEYDSLPGGFIPPAERTKPYGTVHAVYCAKDLIHEPFAVINADDYYGRDAFAAMAGSLRAMAGKKASAAMVAYQLKNTISENGTVTRGICERDSEGFLSRIVETYRIGRDQDGVIKDFASDPAGVPLAEDALVSMNFFGFTPWFFEAAGARLEAFLKNAAGDPLKKEYVLPTLVDRLMREENLKVQVLSTHAVWFGVTYQEDRANVSRELQKLHEAGVYPERLF